MRTRKERERIIRAGRPTPPGFRPVVNEEGRLSYTAKHNPLVLSHHECLQQDLCEILGVEKLSMPDQMDCLIPHVMHRYFLKMDLSKAFNSVTLDMVVGALGMEDDLRKFRHSFFHKGKGLIEGAPASNALFHFYMERAVDPLIAAVALKHKLTWTRYMDDLLFSSNRHIPPSLIEKLTNLLEDAGFKVNAKKTRLLDSFRRELVHLGAVIYRSNVDVKPEYRQRLANALEYGVEDYFQLRPWEDRVLALNNP